MAVEDDEEASEHNEAREQREDHKDDEPNLSADVSLQSSSQ